ncbi:tetratricopeptide repeat protein [Reticulibacter mediterranei]|uniref:Tetratricopeptide repeat protein n=1 Tax=Reticulibacter mediterranei TaxID=2778369 RepID=A0A8J3N7T3_9CHLR|nr:FxSxx-COOH system tetratricopeptide repeat protein [Reticulibacter mediterranei]GHO98815.1 tetratricopeptide repeat protein [Reticulibacter mediterranei]
MDEQERVDFFISYHSTGKDQAWAEWMAWQLEQAGYRVHFQGWDVRPGSNIVKVMDDATKHAERTLLVLSAASLASDEMVAQWAVAFRRDPAGKERRVLPVRIDACEITGLLGSLAFIDLVDLEEQQARDRLLEGVKQQRVKPSTAPFPASEPRAIFPPSFSPLWHVPHPRNPYFVGRDDVLETLHQRLVPGEKATAITQSISGLGGIGKTQLALEYAHRYTQDYTSVLWVPADSLETTTASWLQIATQVLGLPEQQEADKQIAVVKRWLQTHIGWLLIFDNVEDPHDILSTFVPSKHHGSVLMTTRRRDVGALAQSEMLSLFSEEAATLFLLRRAGRIARDARVIEASADDVKLARTLCHLLDRLPLALDQAGAYIAETGCNLQRYLDLYESYQSKLLARRGEATEHPSVFLTFKLSWEQLHERHELVAQALSFCAFLAPDQIPEQMVMDALLSLQKNDNPPDALALDEALGWLHRYSLIERRDQMVSLHRLVQEVIQEVLSEQERELWMQRAVQVVNAVFPSGEHGTWSLCEILLPHALLCAGWLRTMNQQTSQGARLLNNTGGYLSERGLYKEAEPLLQRALAIDEEQMGNTHPDTATSLNNLAGLYWRQGRYAEAEPLFRRVLAIFKDQMGATHPDTAISLNNLAELYREQGRYAEAELLLQRALAIREEQVGAAHPQTAITLNNLAGLYVEQGRYQEAEPLLQRALAIREEQVGAAHPSTATSLDSLAGLYVEQGRYQEAEPLLQRALAIREEQVGASHPHMARSLNNLAELYRKQSRYQEAESLYQRALAIREEQLGASHPHMARSLNNLAELYQMQGRYQEAKPLLQRALAIREEQLGAAHPHTATSLNSLAGLYWHQGHYQEAEPLYQRALAIREEQLGAAHPSTATSLNNLAALYKSQGRYQEAEPLMQRALTIFMEQVGAFHPDTAASLNNLAGLYVEQGRYQEAEPLMQRALAIREKQVGAFHPDTATSLNNLAGLYVEQSRYQEAESLYQRALAILEALLGATHPNTATSLNNLATLYVKQGRYQEAESLLQRALTICQASFGMEHPLTQRIVKNYMVLLADLHTNGDVEALLYLLAQHEQEEPSP